MTEGMLESDFLASLRHGEPLMAYIFPEIQQRLRLKKADPLIRFRVHNFLSQHYTHLFKKLEEYLLVAHNQYLTEIKDLPVTTAYVSIISWAFATLYPNTVRYSLFITVYNQFESSMIEACIELEKDHPNAVKLSDLKDKGMTRTYTYLEKVVGIKEPFEPTSWDKLKDLNALRNVIVHNNAKIEKPQTKISIERIQKWAPVRVKDDIVFLSETFIEHVNNFFHEQITYIAKKLEAAGWD
jgi:hypothetical protein